MVSTDTTCYQDKNIQLSLPSPHPTFYFTDRAHARHNAVQNDRSADSTQQPQHNQVSKHQHPLIFLDMTIDYLSPQKTMTCDYLSPYTTLTGDYLSPQTTLTGDYLSPHTTLTGYYLSPQTTLTGDYLSPHTTLTGDYLSPQTTLTGD